MCYFSSFELFLLVGGGYALFVLLFVLATVVLLNAVISRVLAWFWVDLGKIAFFYDTVFGVSQSWIVRCFCWTLLFLEFWAGFEWSWYYCVCVCVLRLVFALKLWSFVFPPKPSQAKPF